MDSYFEKGIRLKGTLWVKGLVHFDGDFEGEIYSSDHFIVGKSGKILGNIKTYNVTNKGFVQGNMLAENKVALMNDSRLTGDISTYHLIIDEGSNFEGRCKMIEEAPKSVREEMKTIERPVPKTAKVSKASSNPKSSTSGGKSFFPLKKAAGIAAVVLVVAGVTWLYPREGDNLEHLVNWVTLNRELVDKNPAAFCSFELALLDLISRKNRKSPESIIGLKELECNFRYTAVLGILSREQFTSQVKRYLKIGFNDFKIKLSGKYQLDKDNIKHLNTTITNSKIRLDANNLWINWRSAADYIKNLDFDFVGVEEPLHRADFEGMQKFSNSTNTPVIVDESFLHLEHLKHIKSSPKNWVINLRISKMGGILRSIEIANQAKRLGLPLIIGAQVGETSILSRAALSIANHYRDLVIAQEGAFGTYLLEEDITDDPIIFGKDGVLESSTIANNGNGWGIKVRTLK